MVQTLGSHSLRTAHFVLVFSSALAGCGPGSSNRADELLKALAGSPDEQRADQLTRELIDLGPGVVPRLVQALGDDNPSMRAAAAAILGKERAEAAIPQLATCLEDAEELVRDVAASALAEIGPSALSVVTMRLGHARAEVRRAAATTLWRMRDASQPALPDLVSALERERNADVFGALCFALREWGAAGISAAPVLVARMGDADPRLSHFAVSAMGYLGPSAVPPLVSALRDARGGRVAGGAADALGDIGARAADAVPALLEALDGGPADVRRSAARALGRIGGLPAVVTPALTRHVDDADIHVRAEAIVALGRFGGDAAGAVEALLSRLPQEQDEVADGIVRTLGAIGPAAAPAVPLVVPRLASPNRGTRIAAMRFLSGVGKEIPQASLALATALHDEDNATRAWAAIALRTSDPTRFRAEAGRATSDLLLVAQAENHDDRIRALGALADLADEASAVLSDLRDLYRIGESAPVSARQPEGAAHRRAEYLEALRGAISRISGEVPQR